MNAKSEETTAENFTKTMKTMKPQSIKDKTDTQVHHIKITNIQELKRKIYFKKSEGGKKTYCF